MPYRRTENVVRRLNARHHAILEAARAVAAEGGMAAVQIVPVAQRADIAAGTVYRYFPGKTDLVAALIETLTNDDVAAIRKAADAAPGPLSALAAAIATFAMRVSANRRMVHGLLADAGEAAIDMAQARYRDGIATELAHRIEAASAAGHLPAQDGAMAARAVIGAIVAGLSAPADADISTPPDDLSTVQTLALFSLRALGVADARARGLVVQAARPTAAHE